MSRLNGRGESIPLVFSALCTVISLQSKVVAQNVPSPSQDPTPNSIGAPPVAPPIAATESAPAAAAAKETKWYERIDVGAFVDTYFNVNWRSPRPNAGANLYHPYTNNSGFNLAWVGLDASVAPDPIGVTLNLRFGPAVPNLALGDFGIPGGIGFVQNGYVSWKPSGKDGRVTLILGKFDTLYGAEVAQSHLNINYTRGMLYNLAQPFFHTGLRADVQINDYFGFKVIAVNGWNNTIDNNLGKSFGTTLTLTPAAGKSISMGYLGGPEENDTTTLDCSPKNQVFDRGRCVDPIAGPPASATSGTIDNPGSNSRWRHIIDVVADMQVTPAFRVVVNGDYIRQTVIDSSSGAESYVSWYGASLLARFQLSDIFAVGARGEIIKDPNGQISAPNTGPLSLATGTLTIDAAVAKYLLLRLDNRLDYADQPVFRAGVRDLGKTQFTSTFGVVAKTN